MELSEIRAKNAQDLEVLEELLRRNLADLRLKLMVGSMTDTTALRKLKREIARVLTVHRETQGAAAQDKKNEVVL